MKHFTILLFIFFQVLFSCKKNNLVTPPVITDTVLKNTLSLSDTLMDHMEGIYELVDGGVDLGTEFVCKASKNKVSFFSNAGGGYIILKYGFNPVDGAIQFTGFWRFSESILQGQINLSVHAEEGASELLHSGNASQLTLTGNFYGLNNSSQRIRIKFKRPFTQFTIDNEFMIFAHHGVQTTANPPYTENSLNGAIHDQDYGVNGLEFDVHLTKDHIPICAHDASIDIRVTQKGPLSGEYIQYSFAFLDSSVRLTDGEKIPSVEQVLNAFIDSTSLKYMWLDVKGDPDVFEYLEPVVRRAYAKAAAANRKIVIVTDLTSDKVVSEFESWPDYNSLPTMSELSLDDAIKHNCKFWAPRYSLGLLLDDVHKAHRLGIKVLSWTLNDRNLIRDYMTNGNFDGFISDYPAYIVYDYYTLF